MRTIRAIRAIRNDLVRSFKALIAVRAALIAAALAAGGAYHFTAAPAPVAAANAPAGERWAVTVSAGKFDRQQTPVTFPVPDGVAPDREWRLLSDGNAAAPALQILPADAEAGGRPDQETKPTRRGVFVVRDLKAGQSRTFSLVRAKVPDVPPDAVRAVKEGGVITVSLGGKQVLRYQGEKSTLPAGFGPEYQRGGYIASVHTPGGKLVTDDYPPNHKHHHGIWSPWTKTEFEGRHPDFWNMGDKTGTVEFVAFGDLFSGPVAGGFAAKHRFIDLTAKPEPKAALDEWWRVDVYDVHGAAGRHDGNQDAPQVPYFLFDWQSTQTCASASPLTLLEYRYGGLGFRGNRAWDGAPNLTFLTSEGKEGRGANGSRARWVYLGGQVEGQSAGIAILCSPENFRAPQPVRIHPTEPFFCYAPEQLGEFKIEPGKPYLATYRFVVLDGKPDAAMKELIERLWNDYAEPPKVEVKEVK